MTRYFLSSTSQKISTRKNLAREAADEKTVLASGASRRKRFSLEGDSFLLSSLHKYINKQQPIMATVSSGEFHASPRTVRDTVVCIQTWTRNVKKIGSKWIQTWYVRPPNVYILRERYTHTPGGTLGYFLGGYVPPGTPNWHPVLKTISPKIDTPF